MFAFVKENKKWLYSIIITIVLFIGVSKLINSCSHAVINGLMNEVETESVKKLSMHIEKEAEQILLGVVKKNGDWSAYPLSKAFLEKYNCKDGIFPQYRFKDVDCIKMSSEQYKVGVNQGVFIYRIGNNLTLLTENNVRRIQIVYYLNMNNELDDIEIISDKQTVDENGNTIIEYNEEFKPNNIYIIAQILFYDKDANNETLNLELMKIDKEPISEHFKSEVKYEGNDKDRVFIDFFPEIDYNFGELYFGIIKTREEAFQQRKIYATCQKFAKGKEPYYDEPEKIYLYEVNFQFDSQNKLDDISVKYIKEISFEEYLKQYE